MIRLPAALPRRTALALAMLSVTLLSSCARAHGPSTGRVLLLIVSLVIGALVVAAGGRLLLWLMRRRLGL
jgi:hypothetical protein